MFFHVALVAELPAHDTAGIALGGNFKISQGKVIKMIVAIIAFWEYTGFPHFVKTPQQFTGKAYILAKKERYNGYVFIHKETPTYRYIRLLYQKNLLISKGCCEAHYIPAVPFRFPEQKSVRVNRNGFAAILHQGQVGVGVRIATGFPGLDIVIPKPFLYSDFLFCPKKA